MKIKLPPLTFLVFVVERVKAGLRNAKGKGKRIGRPKVDADSARIAARRKAGHSWSEITHETGLTKGTAQRAFYSLPKNICSSIVGVVATGVAKGR